MYPQLYPQFKYPVEFHFFCFICDWRVESDWSTIAHNAFHQREVDRRDGLQWLASICPHFSLSYRQQLNTFLLREIGRCYQIDLHDVVFHIRRQLKTLNLYNVDCFPIGAAALGCCYRGIEIGMLLNLNLVECSPFTIMERLKDLLNATMEICDSMFVLRFRIGEFPILLGYSSKRNFDDFELLMLIKKYITSFPEIGNLILLVRKWANVAELDFQNGVGIRDLGTPVLVIHYLQQSGYLPVLPTDSRSPALLNPYRTRQWDLEIEWINFFKFLLTQGKQSVYQITQQLPMRKVDPHYPIRSKGDWHCIHPYSRQNLIVEGEGAKNWRHYFINVVTTTYLSYLIPRHLNGPSIEVKLISNEEIASNDDNSVEVSNCLSGSKHLDYPYVIQRSHIDIERMNYLLNVKRFFWFAFDKKSFVWENKFTGPRSSEQSNSVVLKQIEDLSQLDIILSVFFEGNKLTNNFLKELDPIVLIFEKKLRAYYEKDAKILRLGSLASGLGTSDSDFNLTVVYDGQNDCCGMSEVSELRRIKYALHTVKTVTQVELVCARALTPTISFFYGDRKVKMSFFRTLDIKNTELLQQYARWTPDNRFAKLAMAVNYWAKYSGITQVRKGGISSYGYNIMLVSFLQRCTPPVLPCLQEDFRTEDTEPELICDIDVYFHVATDEEIVAWQKNTQTCGELLVAFFEYYAKFDYETYAIQCRNLQPLTKSEMNCVMHLIGIQDPIDQNRNICVLHTEKEFNKIFKSFFYKNEKFVERNMPAFSIPWRL